MRVVLSNFSVEEETLEEFRSLQNELSRVISFYHPDLCPVSPDGFAKFSTA